MSFSNNFKNKDLIDFSVNETAPLSRMHGGSSVNHQDFSSKQEQVGFYNECQSYIKDKINEYKVDKRVENLNTCENGRGILLEHQLVAISACKYAMECAKKKNLWRVGHFYRTGAGKRKFKAAFWTRGLIARNIILVWCRVMLKNKFLLHAHPRRGKSLYQSLS